MEYLIFKRKSKVHSILGKRNKYVKLYKYLSSIKSGYFVDGNIYYGGYHHSEHFEYYYENKRIFTIKVINHCKYISVDYSNNFMDTICEVYGLDKVKDFRTIDKFITEYLNIEFGLIKGKEFDRGKYTIKTEIII